MQHFSKHTQSSNIFVKQSMSFFLPPYQITFFLVFDEIIFSCLMLSHHILMNILNMNFYNYFVTKRSLKPCSNEKQNGFKLFKTKKKKNSFKPLKQSMFTFTTKTF